MAAEKLKVCMISHSSREEKHSYGYGAIRVIAHAHRHLDNVEFSFHDLKMGYGEDSELMIIDKTRPHILGLSIYLWNVGRAAKIAADVRSNYPDTIIVLGGPGAVGYETMAGSAPSPDFIVRGEGEAAFTELLAMASEGVLGKGRRFSASHSEVRKDDCAPEILCAIPPDLDRITSPYLGGLFSPPGNFVYLETSRGCPNMCAFCILGNSGCGLRYFNLDTIRDELIWAGEVDKPKINLCDAAINYNTERLRAFVETALDADSGGKLSFSFALHADFLDEEQISILTRLNVDCATMGLNSLAPETYKTVRRRIDGERFKAKAALLKNMPNSNITIMMGLPGDTVDGFKRTLDFCESLDINVNCFELKVFPGTYFFDNASALDLKYDVNNDMNVVSSFSFTERDLNVMRETIAEYIRGGSRFCQADSENKS